MDGIGEKKRRKIILPNFVSVFLRSPLEWNGKEVVEVLSGEQTRVSMFIVYRGKVKVTAGTNDGKGWTSG